MQIKRSSTGKYHLGTPYSTNANCNQWMRTRPSTLAMAQKAPDSMLCEKCFSGRYKGHAQLNLLIEIGHFEFAEDKPMRSKMGHGLDDSNRFAKDDEGHTIVIAKVG
tara:strand:- start:652 stop:972 length:321 start_codon:yes stop_codon:yes gene_type:complete